MADVSFRPERHGGANRILATIIIVSLLIVAFFIVYTMKEGASTSPSAPSKATSDSTMSGTSTAGG